MPGEAGWTHVQLMGTAVDGGDLDATEIASAALLLRLGLGGSDGGGVLNRPGLQIQTGCDEQGAEGEGADAGSENAFILMLGKGGGEQNKAQQHR